MSSHVTPMNIKAPMQAVTNTIPASNGDDFNCIDIDAPICHGSNEVRYLLHANCDNGENRSSYIHCYAINVRITFDSFKMGKEFIVSLRSQCNG